ncbi:hypothetical protein NFI96_007588 [Prochilodus magdalenae]|nr:hypothetical protein NFI96_007588 [Prochilodus magdalenae]
MTDYMNFCMDVVVPVKTVRCFANKQPWITSSVKGLLNKKKRVFKDNNQEELRSAQRELKVHLREAKESYRRKVEQKLRENNMREVWSDFKYNSESCHMPKFWDNTAIVACVRGGQEMEYTNLVENFVAWCHRNNLLLNTSKTKETVVDFRRAVLCCAGVEALRREMRCVWTSWSGVQGFLPHSLTMAIPDNRALQHLAAELAPLARQTSALLKKQNELLQMKSLLEASRGVSRSPASSSAASEVLAPPRPQHTPGHPIFTPAPQGVLKRQLCRGRTRPFPPPQPSFAHDNRFSALSSPPTPTPVSRPPSPTPAPRASSQDSVYVIGSSIVRHVRVHGARGDATVACFPGARVLDIARRLPTALSNCNAFGTVVIHVGTNDICARQSEVLKEHYQTLQDTARKSTNARIVISGPLPTYRKCCERFSRLFGLQSWLRD